jgi:septum formation topological specificity factor MinE
MIKEKSISIIDFIKNITINKVPWESYSENDVKACSSYMITQWMSMNYNTVEFVNELQRYLGILDKREYYKLFMYAFPKVSIYIQYIKSKSEKKYNTELLSLLSKYYEISNSEVRDYLDIFLKNDENIKELIAIIRKYGKSDKEIKKLLTT